MKAIWNDTFNKTIIDELLSIPWLDFDTVIGVYFSNVDYIKSHGIQIYSWVTDRNQYALQQGIQYIQQGISNGLILDPETSIISPFSSQANQFYNTIDTTLVVGSATWVSDLGYYGMLATNLFYGINLSNSTIWGKKYNLKYIFPMAYPFVNFLYNTRFNIYLNEYQSLTSQYTVVPIVQAFEYTFWFVSFKPSLSTVQNQYEEALSMYNNVSIFDADSLIS